MQDVDLKRDRSLLAADWQRYGFTSRHLLNDAAAFIRDAEAPRPLTRPRPLAPGSP